MVVNNVSGHCGLLADKTKNADFPLPAALIIQPRI